MAEPNQPSDTPRPNERIRKCPSCGEPIFRLNLSAIPMPAEQLTMGWLNMMNKNASLSVRTFGQSSLHELQFLCFTNICPNCGHISWWDLPTEEVAAILKYPDYKPRIAYNSDPKFLQDIVDKIPEEYRKPLLDLIKSLIPQEAK